MAICPKCQSWLNVNLNAPDTVRCNQGHHYKKGEVKLESLPSESAFPKRGAKLSADYEFDERLNRWVRRGNWNP